MFLRFSRRFQQNSGLNLHWRIFSNGHSASIVEEIL
jgi:hypothetical protein